MADPRVLKVLVVDDHQMMGEGLSAVLGSDERFDVVGVATTGREGIDKAADGAIDVAVVDFRLPDMDGAEVTRELKRRSPEVAVVLVTAADGYGVISSAIAAGAEGFVHKSSPISDIVDAAAAVAAGDSWFPPQALASLSQTVQSPSSGIGSDLTDREIEVLSLLTNGATTEAIVDALVLSPHTVRNHVRNLMAKLGAHSKLEAVTIAFRAGLVQLEGDERA